MANASTVLKSKASVVVLTDDIPGAPRGTKGKVTFVSGLSWIRYWVKFDNGSQIGSIHRDKLATPDEWLAKKDQKTFVATTGGADAGVGIVVDIDPSGIPAHLLERSRNARARLAAKAG